MKRVLLVMISCMYCLLALGTAWAVPTVELVQPLDGGSAPVSTTVSATFSEAMDPATITSGSFTVSRFVGIKSIVAGVDHNVAIKNDGTVVAWGDNVNGQCTVPAGLTGVVAVAAGGSHTVALKSDGTVVAWGSNTYGESTVPSGLSGVVAIAAWGAENVVLKSDGTVVTWGGGYYGQSMVPAGLSGVVAIAKGTYRTVALKNDGTVVNWGWDQYGFRTFEGLTGVVAITAGASQTLALKSDGTVVRWFGLNINGASTQNGLSGIVAVANDNYSHFVALKSDGTVYRDLIMQEGLSGVVAIRAGQSHFVALKSDGTVVVLGDNNYFSQDKVPAGLSGVVAITAAGDHTVALKSDGTMVAWGDDYYGQGTVPVGLSGIGAVAVRQLHYLALKNDGTVVNWGPNYKGLYTVPVGLSEVIAIAAGSSHSVALKSDGTVVAWGSNATGRSTVPTGLSGVVAVAAGSNYSVALKSDGTVVAWGDNFYGQIAVPSELTGVVAIAAGFSHTVALKSDGTVVAWGLLAGQSTVPAGLSGVVAIAAGGGHTVALKNDGTVVAWGSNNSGECTVPSGLSGVVAIAAGYNNTIALKSDGTVVAWGDNRSGQSTVPVGLSGVIAISAGFRNVAALKSDGTVVGWGDLNVFSPLSLYEKAVEGTVAFDQATNKATFTASAPLEAGVTYFATVNTGVRNAAGEHLAADVRWSFSTVSGDTVPPTIVPTITGTLVNGWYTGKVTVALAATDDVTGVKSVSYAIDGGAETVVPGATASFDLFGDGLRKITYGAIDNANNPANGSITIPIDTTPPTFTQIERPQPNANGWYNRNVIVRFSATDALSGIASLTPDTVVSTEGPGQTVTGTAVDVAGNSSSYDVTGINVDKTPPAVTITGVTNGATYNLGLVPTANFSAVDGLSGVSTSSGALSGGDAQGLGPFTYTVTATDNAGNTAFKSVEYTVNATTSGTVTLIGTLPLDAQTAAILSNALETAMEFYARGNSTAGDEKLGAFINQVSAPGQNIPPDIAVLLINAANFIITHN